jgi:hypothetical protein
MAAQGEAGPEPAPQIFMRFTAWLGCDTLETIKVKGFRNHADQLE